MSTDLYPRPREGYDFCPCGAKYWDGDVCASCGERFRPLTRTERWAGLRPGMSIVCPGSGQLERVVYVLATARRHVMVRTTNHDHTKPRGATVEVLVPEG